MPSEGQEKEENKDIHFAFGQLGNYPKFPVTKVQNLFRKKTHLEAMTDVRSSLPVVLESQSHYKWLSGVMENFGDNTIPHQVLEWQGGNDTYDMTTRNPWNDFPRFIFELGLYHCTMEIE